MGMNEISQDEWAVKAKDKVPEETKFKERRRERETHKK